MLENYDILAAHHARAYLEKLNEHQRLIWSCYLLPPLPDGFLEKLGLRRMRITAAQQRRKEQSDVLVPLFPLLVEIAQLRKQAAERLSREFRRLRDQVLAGAITLPYRFQYTDRVIDITKNAATLADVTLLEREVTLSLTLWDRSSWVETHPERYPHHPSLRKMRRAADASAPTMYFLQYEGPLSDFLWCGDLLAKGFAGKLHGKRGWRVDRPGLLSPKWGDGHWLARGAVENSSSSQRASIERCCMRPRSPHWRSRMGAESANSCR
jgi:hypothetical protein